MSKKIVVLSKPRSVKLQVPHDFAIMRTELQKLLGKPVRVFAYLSRQGISLVGAPDSITLQKVPTHFVKGA